MDTIAWREHLYCLHQSASAPCVERALNQLWTNGLVICENIYKCTSHAFIGGCTLHLPIYTYSHPFLCTIKSEHSAFSGLPFFTLHSIDDQRFNFFHICSRA